MMTAWMKTPLKTDCSEMIDPPSIYMPAVPWLSRDCGQFYFTFVAFVVFFVLFVIRFSLTSQRILAKIRLYRVLA